MNLKLAVLVSVAMISLGLAACSQDAGQAQDDRFNPEKHKDMANIYKQYEATPRPAN